MLYTGILFAQNTAIQPDSSLLLPPDTAVTLQNEPVDTANVSYGKTPADTVVKRKVPTSNTIQSTIEYDAKDSINFDVLTQTVHLHGDAHVRYKDMQLKADYIGINYRTNVITAHGTMDSTGRLRGKPYFKDGDEEFVIKSIKYNYKTEKGIISEVVTTQGEGYITGDSTFKDNDNVMYMKGAKYTTCNKVDPHYHIKFRKSKHIPDDRTITGPFNLTIADVPLPLGMPFGVFPSTETKSSGLIFPVWGESDDRGFFLRNGGYYWAVNDYIGTKLIGEIWTKGGWGLHSFTDYKVRYRFDGNLNWRYVKTVRNADELENRVEISDFWVQWNHRPVARAGKRFSANVNAGTSTYNANNSYNTDNYLSSNFNSDIQYYNRFGNSPFSLGANLRHNQNNITGVYTFTLPSLNFSMNRIYPFRALSSSTKTSNIRDFYESIGVQYRADAQQVINNEPRAGSFPFTVANEEFRADTSIIPIETDNILTLIERGKRGIRHSVPISGSMNLGRSGKFKLNPSFNYTELWYEQELKYTYQDNSIIDGADTLDAIRIDTIPGFSRTGYYSAAADLTTRIYGMFAFKGEKELKIRHVMTPSLRYSYRPDFSDPRFGVYENVQTNERGDTRLLSKYQNFLYGSPPIGTESRLGISLLNTLEMKYKKKAKKDTLDSDGTQANSSYKKAKILDNLSLNTSYNFAADSFELADINVALRSTLFNKISLASSMTIDPYMYIIDTSAANEQRQINRYAWQDGPSGVKSNGGIGQVSRASLTAGTSLNPAFFKKGPFKTDRGSPAQLEAINSSPEDYVAWDIPWNFRVNYTVTYNKTGFQDPTLTQSMSFGGDLNLTSKWKLLANSGYDFETKRLTFTNITIIRDLHCWEMRFNWIPFGPRQSYTMDIYVKASILQDLKITRRRDWRDR